MLSEYINRGNTMLSTWLVKASTKEQKVTTKINPELNAALSNANEMNTMNVTCDRIEAAVPSTVFDELGNIVWPQDEPTMLAAESPIPVIIKRLVKGSFNKSNNHIII